MTCSVDQYPVANCIRDRIEFLRPPIMGIAEASFVLESTVDTEESKPNSVNNWLVVGVVDASTRIAQACYCFIVNDELKLSAVLAKERISFHPQGFLKDSSSLGYFVLCGWRSCPFDILKVWSWQVQSRTGASDKGLTAVIPRLFISTPVKQTPPVYSQLCVEHMIEATVRPCSLMHSRPNLPSKHWSPICPYRSSFRCGCLLVPGLLMNSFQYTCVDWLVGVICEPFLKFVAATLIESQFRLFRLLAKPKSLGEQLPFPSVGFHQRSCIPVRDRQQEKCGCSWPGNKCLKLQADRMLATKLPG